MTAPMRPQAVTAPRGGQKTLGRPGGFLLTAPMRPCSLRHQRGLSLVELLVGLALGLFIVATGLTLLVGNLRESRSLTMESRLMQELRTASDVVTRDLRRAGYWAGASAAIAQREPGGVIANPYGALAPTAAESSAVSFRFSRDAAENHQVDANEQFGFRLRSGVLEMQLGSSGWQSLTDATALTVTAFRVTPAVQEISLLGSCAKACPAGSEATCPPRQQLRSLGVLITARSVTEAKVTRSVQSEVRLRNDALLGACPP